MLCHLHRHVQDHCDGNEEVLQSVKQCFYVDNCLQSFPSSHQAKSLIDKMRPLLAKGSFDLRQWASNDPAVIHHLPSDATSKTNELWLSGNGDPKELTLGLQWNCLTDMLSYKTKSITYHQLQWGIYTECWQVNMILWAIYSLYNPSKDPGTRPMETGKRMG